MDSIKLDNCWRLEVLTDDAILNNAEFNTITQINNGLCFIKDNMTTSIFCSRKFTVISFYFAKKEKLLFGHQPLTLKLILRNNDVLKIIIDQDNNNDSKLNYFLTDWFTK